MCCFSGAVEHVADTKIFVRTHFDRRQFLVYEMRYESADDVAMILPIPVKIPAAEDAVKFINLEDYPTFFRDLESGFPKSRGKPAMGGMGGFGGGNFGAKTLDVVEVGEFEASFVPQVKDFSRLDERFRLPEEIWTETVPRYKDWGFVVFKLKKGNQRVHPMAFSFPRRGPKAFFPTLHIHDGSVPEKAGFDHVLYGQFIGIDPLGYFSWESSPQPAQMFVDMEKCQGLLDGAAHVYRRKFRGEQANRDIVV